MATVTKRIISSRVVARRLGISHEAISKHIRRELLRPDRVSDSAVFFDPTRLPQLRKVIAENRQRNWRHIGASDGVCPTPNTPGPQSRPVKGLRLKRTRTCVEQEEYHLRSCQTAPPPS